jgi:hypothetical protein
VRDLAAEPAERDANHRAQPLGDLVRVRVRVRVRVGVGVRVWVWGSGSGSG